MNDKPIKLIILAYDYPPYVSVGGLRPYSWSKYLPEFGVFPIVITRQWDNKYGNHLDYIAPSVSTETVYEKSNNGIIIKAPYIPNLANNLLLKYGESKFSLLRKGISGIYEIGQFFYLSGAKSSIYFAADKYLAKNKADIIIATGEPFILFKYASALSEKYNIPWIADYRDPWTQDKSRNEKGFPRTLDVFLEKKILSNASAVTTVSTFFQRKIETLILNKSFYILPNGYNEDAINSIKHIEQSKIKLSIGFVGTIYKWHPIESFLRVSNDFVGNFVEKPKFEINFYGINIEDKIKKLIFDKYHNLETVVNVYPKMSNEKLLKKLAKNNLLLLFNYYSYMGTKIYEYLALKRQILLCYDDDEETQKLKDEYYNMDEEETFVDNHPQKQAIKATNSGIIVKDDKHLKQLLNSLYAEFEEKRFIECNSLQTEKYSRKIQVKKLAEIINQVINK